MKNLLILFCFIFSITAFAQVEKTNYSIFNRSNAKKNFFITTNSGVLNTPVGLKVGFVSSPGLYVGFRHGIGTVYHSDTDFTTTMTNLFSITGGVNFPLYKKNDLKVFAQVGGGYGQWWDYLWERWSKSGYELEGGLMVQRKNLILNVTGNLLNASKTYATADLCVGIGFVMNSCN